VLDVAIDIAWRIAPGFVKRAFCIW
jgi:hypothetical protein